MPSFYESAEKKEQGCDTQIRFTFVRHTQKAPEGSEKTVTESGLERAKTVGAALFSKRDIKKAYATAATRTKDTLMAAFNAAGIDTDILQKSENTAAFFSLPMTSASEDYRKIRTEMVKKGMQKYLEKKFPGKKLSELTPDEKEEVEENGEEPAVQSYLDYGDKRPDNGTQSPREQAAAVAFKINRLVNLPDYMPSGRAIDLVSAGHKTSTEAFLKYVLERKENDQVIVGFDKLETIGGSLKILDSWDLQVKNDDQGKKNITIVLRRENGKTQEFGLNKEALQELAKEYIKTNKLKPKTIDSPQ